MSAVTYQVKQDIIQFNAQHSLIIKSLLDHQQFYDPQQQAQRLGICSAAWPIFGLVWPSSIQLAKKLLKRTIAADQRILEIGCGLGIASMVAKQLGLNITASDRHPLAPKFLRKNTQLNNLAEIPFLHGQWGVNQPASILDTNAPLLSGTYDYILASDILYEPDNALQVAQFIQRYAAPEATIWLVDPNRGYHNHVRRHLAEFGFQLAEQVRLEHGPGEEQYRGRLLVFQR